MVWENTIEIKGNVNVMHSLLCYCSYWERSKYPFKLMWSVLITGMCLSGFSIEYAELFTLVLPV